ncbi:MAG: response regulator [Phycisphaerae bacterium]|nr:response regulator [Phycisphaerae bacterium]NIP55065.1 response regulator [Phycisphaerae bacterium]NIS53776.1 response regulator [Phycisphaerae bacterium]NIU11354.1 response regulator [Phycisphaerae bacterium]NIU57484.1 response regulator [Phycisphaerae bacterium]
MKKDIVILIAEDNAGHFQLIKKNLWLTCVDHDILQFKNGKEILNFLFKTDTEIYLEEDKKYVLLLDIRMPQVDGLEVLKKIKDDQKLRKIPVIMLTTTSDASMIRQCYELGCSYYIVKPVDYHYFMEAVQNLGEFLSLESMRLPSVSENSD